VSLTNARVMSVGKTTIMPKRVKGAGKGTDKGKRKKGEGEETETARGMYIGAGSSVICALAYGKHYDCIPSSARAIGSLVNIALLKLASKACYIGMIITVGYLIRTSGYGVDARVHV
jgi:hypothetical protein